MVLIGIDPYPHYSSIFVGGRVQKDVCFARHMGMDWLQLHCFTNLENNLFRQQQEHWTGNSDGNTPSVQNSGSAMCVRLRMCFTLQWLQVAGIEILRNCRLNLHLGMDQYLLIPFLGGWTSIYQLFWCSPGVQGFDTAISNHSVGIPH